MFDQLFRCPKAVKHHLDSPLLESRLAYLNYCAEQGMAKTTLQVLAERLLVIINYLELHKKIRKIDIAEIEQAANSWATRLPANGNLKDFREVKKRFIGVATQWLKFLGCLNYEEKAVYSFSFMVDEFIDYLSKEKGLSEVTIHNYQSHTKDFLISLYKSNLLLSEIRISKIQELIISKANLLNWSRVTTRHYACSLRAFLKYAQTRNWCKSGLDALIMTPCIYTQEGIPMGPSWENVQLLISSINNNSETHIRNLPIVMLIALYGLRSSEVCQLRLENIDWEKEQITIKRSKRGKTQIYPLSHIVGNAILKYLKEVRPKSKYREVFLTKHSPIKPLSGDAIYNIVSRHLQSLNITLNHYGPHSLRHACASHLLAEGLSLKEIGDYLGHHRPSATRIYAKVDINGLREVANLPLGGLL